LRSNSENESGIGDHYIVCVGRHITSSQITTLVQLNHITLVNNARLGTKAILLWIDVQLTALPPSFSSSQLASSS